jgi:hypothetical protein
MISGPDYDALHALLPFYVNGTISDPDRAQVDAALPQSPELREALANERALKGRIVDGVNAVTEQNDEVIAAREALLMARTKVVEAPLAAVADMSEPSGLQKALSFLNPKRWHPAMALTLAAAVVGQAAVIGGQATTIAALEEENFQLASGPCEDRDQKGRIMLEVKEDTGFAALAELLNTEGLKIVDSAGVGSVTVKSGLKDAALTAQIERLRKAAILSSADPAA